MNEKSPFSFLNRLIIQPQFAFGRLGSEKYAIPPMAEVIYVVTLHEFEVLPETYLTDDDDSWSYANDFKERGNGFFKLGKYENAIDMFSKAHSYMYAFYSKCIRPYIFADSWFIFYIYSKIFKLNFIEWLFYYSKRRCGPRWRADKTKNNHLLEHGPMLYEAQKLQQSSGRSECELFWMYCKIENKTHLKQIRFFWALFSVTRLLHAIQTMWKHCTVAVYAYWKRMIQTKL